ncbi:MAG: hypothetical protein AB1489_03915 [Acidobacteriota bacterium]
MTISNVASKEETKSVGHSEARLKEIVQDARVVLFGVDSPSLQTLGERQGGGVNETPAKSFSHPASIFIIFVSILALLGWLLDIETLKRVLADLVTMKAHTAFAFLLSSLSLWLLQVKPVRPKQVYYGEQGEFYEVTLTYSLS